MKIIQYYARDWAKDFHKNRKRYSVLVMHRRSGKTVASLMELVMGANNTPNGRFAYLAPFYKQAKNVSWDILRQIVKDFPKVKINVSELKVDFPNGARIMLLGADNPDALRGMKLHGVVFDEYSQQPASIFTEVVRPMLSDTKGWAVWIGTPKGMNDFYRLYTEHKDDSDWYVKLLRASESNLIDTEELKDALKTMSVDEYNQEYECSFTAAIKGAYYAAALQEARLDKRIGIVPYEPQALVYTAWDLGISETTCIIFFQIIGKEVRIIDYYQNNNAELKHYTEILQQKSYIYGKHYLPHDIAVRELGTGKSRLEILQNLLGRDKIEKVKDIGVKDGIEAVRVIFPKCWFSDKTFELIDGLGQYTQEWDDKKGMFKDKPLHNWASHPADSMRMLAVGIKEKTVSSSKPYGNKKYKTRPIGDDLSRIVRKLNL